MDPTFSSLFIVEMCFFDTSNKNSSFLLKNGETPTWAVFFLQTTTTTPGNLRRFCTFRFFPLFFFLNFIFSFFLFLLIDPCTPQVILYLAFSIVGVLDLAQTVLLT